MHRGYLGEVKLSKCADQTALKSPRNGRFQEVAPRAVDWGRFSVRRQKAGGEKRRLDPIPRFVAGAKARAELNRPLAQRSTRTRIGRFRACKTLSAPQVRKLFSEITTMC
jgi:hypothetical protein